VILAAAIAAAVLAQEPVAPAAADHRAAAPTRAEAPAGVESPALILYRVRVADGNLMGVTVTNYGFVGNDFVSRSPSMEYPLGTGYEHLVNGGLWIGAHSSDANGAFTGVTTGCLDIAQGMNSATVTEFTPSGDAIAVRSNHIGPY